MPSPVKPRPSAGKTYPPDVREKALRLASEVGAHQAAKQLGIAYNTIRRWRDPGFRASEALINHRRRRAPCQQCARQTNIHGRRHPEQGLLCRSCLATRLADQRRGWTADQLAEMYRDQLMSTNEISAISGLTQSGVHALLKRHGVHFRTVHEAIKLHPGGQQEHGKADPSEIRDLYLSGLSIPKIATEIACSAGTVHYHLDKLGLRKQGNRSSSSGAST
jgi:transposase-like protein